MEEINIDKVEWTTLEHEHKEHNVDWFWAIGLIVIISAGASIWMKNYLFAIFIFISGASLIFITLRKPQEITFSFDTKGLIMGGSSHPWKEIKGFNIIKGETNDLLLVETSKQFLPIYTITIPQNLTTEIKESLLKVIPINSEIKESPSMKFMEKLGF